MKISYVGPKVLFTRHGVDFDNNKEDKYVYLNIALQIHKALDHNYNIGEKYIYDINSKRLNDDEILSFVKDSFPEHNELFTEAAKSAKEYLENEIEKVEKLKNTLEAIEYEGWKKNIALMENYVKQRQFNKKIYYAIINLIVKNLKHFSIKEINAPMFQTFSHVFHSIQGALKQKPDAKSSNLEIYEKDGVIMLKLNIG